MTGAPFGTGNFRVEIGPGEGDDPAIDAGFASVGFPEFGVGREGSGPEGGGPDGGAPLLLCRAVTGKRDLYAWWDRARAGGKARRDVRISLIGHDPAQSAMIWTFGGAHPVALSHTPLDANAPGLMLETLALAFDRVEVEFPNDPKPPPKPGIPGRPLR